ncbi:MAG TPA: alpha-amylase family glycosyl hydrolase [Tepidisphaeraceae bacterium]|nr:alpha-amylase family glycosyl hydrolase [Tepidisphaeraceae bacterium]
MIDVKNNASNRCAGEVNRFTHLAAWLVLVLCAPLMLLQVAKVNPVALAQQATAASPEHEFRLDMKQATEKPTTVHVAGEFNGWNPEGLAMTDDGTGMWTAKLALEEGSYQYKFVLDAATDKRKWMEDPAADPELKEPDGNDGYNSVVVIGPGAKKLDAPKPDHINLDAIVFRSADQADVNFAGDLLRVRVRAQAGDVADATLVLKQRVSETGWSTESFPMYRLGSGRGLDSFGTAVAVGGKEASLHITLRDGTAVVDVGGKIRARSTPDDTSDEIAVAVDPKLALETPRWARHAVWYQIFPERFRNGDPDNDPGDKWYENLVPWNGDWWATQPGETPGKENFYKGTGNVWDRRYGGDIAGVREKLPYLRSLGVNAIYFNPVFEAESMHKYDTADFRHIDDNFGVRDEPMQPPIGSGSDKTPTAYQPIGNRKLFNLDGSPVPDSHVQTDDPSTWRWTKSDLLFLDFLKEARRQGFHVIVDGVFNHVGRAHPFFQDVLVNGRNSPYASWFEITDFGDPANWRAMDDPWKVHGKPGGIQFKAWDSMNGHLPVFKKDPARGLASGPYEHIMAITRRWLDPDGDPSTRDGIDGWRLDVPGDIPHPFWIEWRKTVKSANPEGYISGEIWSWANPWINNGDQFDAVMNYQFAMPAQEFFANQKSALKPSQFNDRLVRLTYNYPFRAALVMQNLFDSHDTDRSASWFVNPDRPYDGQNREQDNAAAVGYDARRPTETEWARWLQMVACQMTFVGAPMIYYGNEFGMYSPDDPSNRMPAWWRDLQPFDNPDFKFDEEILAFHQRTIAIRNKFTALQEGFYRPLVVDDDAGVIAYAREKGDEAVYVVINRSNQPTTVQLPVANGRRLFDYLSESAKVSFEDDGAASRPTISVASDAKPFVVTEGNVRVELPTYGTAILAE